MDDTLLSTNSILRNICHLVCDSLNVTYKIHGLWGYPNCYVTFMYTHKYFKWSCNIYITKQMIEYYDLLKHDSNKDYPDNVNAEIQARMIIGMIMESWQKELWKQPQQ